MTSIRKLRAQQPFVSLGARWQHKSYEDSTSSIRFFGNRASNNSTELVSYLLKRFIN